jgi:hypothetical protein
VVSSQIDLKTGGEEGDPDEKVKYLKVIWLAKNISKRERWNGQKRQERGDLPAYESKIGISAGDRCYSPCHCQSGVSNVEVQAGVRDDQCGRVREKVQRSTIRNFKYMRKKAAKLGYQLVPA